MEREDYMRAALVLAAEAKVSGEVPVGCVVTHCGKIVGRGRNRRETDKNALAHAEIEAIAEACSELSGWRLSDCDLYVTLEPCPMCAGAIINARIARVFFGARDLNVGACGGVMNLFEENFKHHPQLIGGLLAEECAAILSEFFREIRR
jgi:tRNA(adenine34) deaminase